VKNMAAADYVGIVSANDVPNKLEKTGWHVTKSEFVDAPVFEELPMTLECKMLSYDKKTDHFVDISKMVCFLFLNIILTF
jgi:flavin reductase (DIM6/NTAB) family NADH-FMN oxidoreductase RutF